MASVGDRKQMICNGKLCRGDVTWHRYVGHWMWECERCDTQRKE